MIMVIKNTAYMEWSPVIWYSCHLCENWSFGLEVIRGTHRDVVITQAAVFLLKVG